MNNRSTKSVVLWYKQLNRSGLKEFKPLTLAFIKLKELWVEGKETNCVSDRDRNLGKYSSPLKFLKVVDDYIKLAFLAQE